MPCVRACRCVFICLLSRVDSMQRDLVGTESLLEALALLKTDVEPVEKLRHLNALTAVAPTLFHATTFSLEDVVPSRVFVKWYVYCFFVCKTLLVAGSFFVRFFVLCVCRSSRHHVCYAVVRCHTHDKRHDNTRNTQKNKQKQKTDAVCACRSATSSRRRCAQRRCEPCVTTARQSCSLRALSRPASTISLCGEGDHSFLFASNDV